MRGDRTHQPGQTAFSGGLVVPADSLPHKARKTRGLTSQHKKRGAVATEIRAEAEVIDTAGEETIEQKQPQLKEPEKSTMTDTGPQSTFSAGHSSGTTKTNDQQYVSGNCVWLISTNHNVMLDLLHNSMNIDTNNNISDYMSNFQWQTPH